MKISRMAKFSLSGTGKMSSDTAESGEFCGLQNGSIDLFQHRPNEE